MTSSTSTSVPSTIAPSAAAQENSSWLEETVQMFDHKDEEAARDDIDLEIESKFNALSLPSAISDDNDNANTNSENNVRLDSGHFESILGSGLERRFRATQLSQSNHFESRLQAKLMKKLTSFDDDANVNVNDGNANASLGGEAASSDNSSSKLPSGKDKAVDFAQRKSVSFEDQLKKKRAIVLVMS